MRFKSVLTWCPRERKLRIFRVMWVRGTVGDGNGYSTKLSLALVPRLIGYSRGIFDWRLTLLGLHIHHQRAWGGVHV